MNLYYNSSNVFLELLENIDIYYKNISNNIQKYKYKDIIEIKIMMNKHINNLKISLNESYHINIKNEIINIISKIIKLCDENIEILNEKKKKEINKIKKEYIKNNIQNIIEQGLQNYSKKQNNKNIKKVTFL